MKSVNEKSIDECLVKWQPLLSLSDWDIKPVVVQKDWRKSGDVKIDESNKMAAVMIRSDLDPAYLEQIVVHELLHIKLWGLDMMIEESLNALFGEEDSEGKRYFAQGQFMRELEATTQDLTRALLEASGFKEQYLFNRVQKQIDGEIG
ncbi:MAG: hypothetical protein KAQ97_01375 [Candidatus Fermentibacteraceae bacterium]|nr:hypothetical protein [Candidatus Fermentibacteraceae bacterium]